jgi:subtilisin family serine protease
MSLGGPGGESTCGTAADPEHEAICSLVNAGVTVVVAAGNSAEDASSSTPATYDEVITVSALADFDGAAGGGGSPTCRNDEDDTFANFSNFGADVDIIAPGVCIESSWNDGGYNTISGTSMASPHVAGAAALYLANNPGLSPAQVRAALVAAGNYSWDNGDDPDSTQEPLLDVGTF